jgi:hypothetical protein
MVKIEKDHDRNIDPWGGFDQPVEVFPEKIYKQNTTNRG